MESLELEARHGIKASTGEHIIGFSTDKELDLISYLQRKYFKQAGVCYHGERHGCKEQT